MAGIAKFMANKPERKLKGSPIPICSSYLGIFTLSFAMNIIMADGAKCN